MVGTGRVRYDPGMRLEPQQIDPGPREFLGLSVGNGGWVRAEFSGGLFAYLRLGEFGSKLEMTEQYLRLSDGGPIRSSDRRAVSWGRLVQLVNSHPELRANVRSRLNVPGPDLARAAAAMGAVYGSAADKARGRSLPTHWLAQMIEAQYDDSEVDQAPWPEHSPIRPTTDPPSGVLEVPTGTRYPIEFYEQVAQTYQALKAAGIAPNATMAAANSLPKTTVDRWVRRSVDLGLMERSARGNPVTRW